MIKQILIIIILGLFFLPSNIFAQTDKEIAQKYGISFPITELENCANIDECKAFCNNSDNYQKCTDFAKEHNLTTSSSVSSSSKSDEEILKLASVELGCNTMDECMAFCENEENMDKCMDFASKHNLGVGNASQMKQVMSLLKTEVGCSSMKSCMEACSHPTNSQKCLEVFQQAGMSVEVNYSTQPPNEPPEVWCPKAGENCTWDGNQCTCVSQGDCGKYPGCTWTGKTCECSQTSTYQESSIYQDSPEVWCPKAGTNCNWDGTQCTCGQTQDTTPQTPSQTTSPPADNPYTIQGGETIYKSECLSAGCRWSDNPNSCDCAGVGKDVQGVSTSQGLLFHILDFILGK